MLAEPLLRQNLQSLQRRVQCTVSLAIVDPVLLDEVVA
jgi:hypothetical protein